MPSQMNLQTLISFSSQQKMPCELETLIICGSNNNISLRVQTVQLLSHFCICDGTVDAMHAYDISKDCFMGN